MIRSWLEPMGKVDMRANERGFTLIELIVVIVILGVLSATALPKFVNIGSDARRASLSGVEGAMRAANALVYAKSALAGSQSTASTTVSINGQAVTIAFGYASDVTNLVKVMELGYVVETFYAGMVLGFPPLLAVSPVGHASQPHVRQ